MKGKLAFVALMTAGSGGERSAQFGVLDFQCVDTFRLLGDEHVGVEQLADELDEALVDVGR